MLAGAAPKPNPPANAESTAYNALAISGKIRTEKKYCQRSLSSCSPRSTPAAAPVLAVAAAPKPNPPAIKYAVSKEPHHACGVGEK